MILTRAMHNIALLAAINPDHEVRLYHAKRRSKYKVTGYIMVDIGGVWHQYIQYVDVKTDKIYARTPDNFGNFIETTT